SRPLTTGRGASLDVGPGTLSIHAASLTLESGAALLGRGQRGGAHGGTISIVTTGDVRMLAGGGDEARVDLSAEQLPGSLDIAAGGDVLIDGMVDVHATTGNGFGGTLDVHAGGQVMVTAGATLRVSGGSGGSGGGITLAGTAATIIEGAIDTTGGDGGNVMLTSEGDLTLGAASTLDASAGGSYGDGGDVTMVAPAHPTPPPPLH